VLLLGDAGSGKTHAVEWCIDRLREVDPHLVVMRARGKFYRNDLECVRHLAMQVVRDSVAAPRLNASFDRGMEWFREVVGDSFKSATAVVVVLDRFECFCSRPRQTLLYNLFDLAQDVGVRLSIIGVSERLDVMGMLEKRIRSRFSMRRLHAYLPTDMDGLIKVLLSKFELPKDSGLKPAFLKELSKHLEAALRAKGPEWQVHIDCCRPPSWFLHQCLPLAATLGEAAAAGASSKAGAPPLKRPRLCTSEAASKYLPSQRPEDVRELLLSSICEEDHIVLIALWKIHKRKEMKSQGIKRFFNSANAQAAENSGTRLAKVLHEVKLLHEGGGYVASFVQDRYCGAFDRMLQMGLVRMGLVRSNEPGVCGLPTHAGSEATMLYRPCYSTVNEIYEMLVLDLEKASAGRAGQGWNPLRELPQAIQNWACRTRKG